jgi:hypothetical protein
LTISRNVAADSAGIAVAERRRARDHGGRPCGIPFEVELSGGPIRRIVERDDDGRIAVELGAREKTRARARVGRAGDAAHFAGAPRQQPRERDVGAALHQAMGIGGMRR